MATCVFFGHRDSPTGWEKDLFYLLSDYIENKKVTSFYVGNNGNFDCSVRKVLKQLKGRYPQVHYAVVLAYLPEKPEADFEGNSLFPDGIEMVPRRFAIDYRNRWMIEQADFVVTYVTRSFGGAAKYKALSEKKGKTVINLAAKP